jgi:4-aminobutyrate aminotransferase-like enzyme
MLGVELDSGEHASAAVKGALQRGVILLRAGDDGHVLSITPPLSIAPQALLSALDLLVEAIKESGH